MNNPSDCTVIEAPPPLPEANTVNRGGDERIRLVFVLDSMGLGGSELNAVRTAERLDRRRFDLSVICFNVDGPIRERYQTIGVPVMHLPINSLFGLQTFAAGRRFARYLRSERVQIVHSHDMYSNVFAVPWARAARTPVVLASRRWWYSHPNARLRVANTVAFRMASAVLANSGQVAESVRVSDGVAKGRIRVVPNFADDSAFVPLERYDRERRRAEFGVLPGDVVIGCVARLVPVKDHASLVRAFAAIRATYPAAKLLLIGDGPSRSSIEALARAESVADAVVFAGARTDGLNYHQLFDVSVLASQSEGFPNSLVEAMAAARPVIATAVGGNLDAVDDGHTGRLVPPGDVGALTGALAELLGSPERRRQLGENGLAVAQSRYRADRVIASVETMYENLVNDRARAA